MLKVLVADALPVFRAGIKEILFEEFTFVYFDEASDGPSLTEKIKTGEWDIIVIDSAISVGNTEIINQILRLKPKPQILILNSDPAIQYIKGVIEKEVIGFLNKNASAGQLIKAVQGVLMDRNMQPRYYKLID